MPDTHLSPTLWQMELNIKTAASLAGHSTTRHTEKYVHIIDELKQKAVDSLPDIIVNYK